MRHILPLATLILSSIPAVEARAECVRWKSYMNACWGIVDPSVCTSSENDWSPHQLLNYRQWAYSATPQRACEKFVIKFNEAHPNAQYQVTMPLAGPTQVGNNGLLWAHCYADTNGDGVREIWAPPLEQEAVTLDSCCSRVPNSHYGRTVAATGVIHSGEDFAQSMREEIRKENQRKHGLQIGSNYVASDLGSSGGDIGSFFFWRRASAIAADDPDFDVNPDWHEKLPGPLTTEYVNVDHVIPRIDSHGCPCGDNSPANAIVISAHLNQSMRNSCLDPRRISILNAYSKPPISP